MTDKPHTTETLKHKTPNCATNKSGAASGWFEKDLNFPSVKSVSKPRAPVSPDGSLQSPVLGPVFPTNTKVAYRLERSLHWNKQKYEKLQKFHPADETLHSYCQDNGHPLTASARNVLEAAALTASYQKAIDMGYATGWIADIGGSARRHARARRRGVWSINPDAMGSEIPGDELNKCTHTMQECDCHEYICSMSVHSLYYISPVDLYNFLLKTRSRTHFAVMHDYSRRPSSLFDDELSMVYNGDMMSVKASGNNHSYFHPIPEWINESGYHRVSAKHVLVVKLVKSFLDDHLYIVTVRDWKASFHTSFPVNDPSQAHDTSDIEVLSICRTVYNYAGKIDQYTLNKFLNDVKQRSAEKGIDVEKAMIKAMWWFNNEASHVKNPILLKKKAELGIKLRNATTREMIGTESTYEMIQRYVQSESYRLIALCAAIVLLGFIQPPPVNDLILDWTFSVLTLVIQNWNPIALVVCIGVYWFFKPRFALSLHTAVLDFCSTKEPATIDPSKVMRYTPGPIHRDCEPKERAHPLIYVPDHIPCYPRRCVHNYHTGITNRLLKPMDPQDSEWDKVTIPTWFGKILFRISLTLQPLEWDEWNERFPARKRDANEQQRRRDGGLPPDGKRLNDRKLFIKHEAYPSVGKAPRLISGTNIHYTFEVGRWMVPLTEALAAALNSGCKVFFPLDAPGEDIASYIKEFTFPVDNDFSAFECSQGDRALKIVHDCYRLAGLPKEIIAILTRDRVLIKVNTDVGLKAVCRNMRISGGPDTLTGNTVLNIILLDYAFSGRYNRMVVKGDDNGADVDPNVDLDEVQRRLVALGFQPKLRHIDLNQIEFCSKLLVPVKDGYAMGPKIGRIFAKTFWTKHTNLNDLERRIHLAGVIKGLEHDIHFVPFLRKLIPLAYGYDVLPEFNAYSVHNKQYHEMDYSTLEYYANRYGVPISMMDDTDFQPTGSLPIAIEHPVVSIMCDVDWGVEDNRDLLVQKPSRSYFTDVICAPFIEEILKKAFGVFFLIPLIMFESYVSHSLFPVLPHVIFYTLPLHWAILCHAVVNHLIIMYKGPRDINTFSMANKKKQNKKQQQKKKQGSSMDAVSKAVGPLIRKAIAQGLRGGGAMVGNYIAPGVGGDMGRKAGAGISKILGFGDYKVKSNSLMTAPQFGKKENSIRIRNREFIGDVSSSQLFDSSSYVINPGNSTLFPWLSNIAAAYQQWQANGMIFYFNSTSATAIGSTNTALGTLMMATNYDLAEADYASKVEMLSSYFSNSGPPCEDLMHAIECDPHSRPIDVLYIDQAGESVTDPALFNLGTFQVATAGVQAASVIGELWVSYDITFMKPKMASSGDYSLLQNGPWTVADPLGVLQTDPSGRSIAINADGGYNTIELGVWKGQVINLQVVLAGTSLVGNAVTFTPGAGLNAITPLNQGALGTIAAASSTSASRDAYYEVTTDTASLSVAATLTSGTPTFSTVSIANLGPISAYNTLY